MSVKREKLYVPYIGKHPQSGNEVSRVKREVGIFFDLSIRYLKPPVNKMTQNVLV